MTQRSERSERSERSGRSERSERSERSGHVSEASSACVRIWQATVRPFIINIKVNIKAIVTWGNRALYCKMSLKHR